MAITPFSFSEKCGGITMELWRTCEHIVSLEVEGNDGFDYSYFQCTLTECIHPEWKCPCDDVSNLGGVLNEKNQILT